MPEKRHQHVVADELIEKACPSLHVDSPSKSHWREGFDSLMQTDGPAQRRDGLNDTGESLGHPNPSTVLRYELRIELVLIHKLRHA